MKPKMLHKLLAILIVTAALPLTVVSMLLIGIGREHVETTVRQVHRLEADAAATRVRDFMQRSEERLLADFETALDQMTNEEVAAWLVFVLGKQDNVFNYRILTVLDSVGEPIGDPVWLPESSIPPEHREAFLVEEEDVEIFRRAIPLAAAMQERQTAFSPVYVNERRREALIAMAIPVVDGLGQLRWTVAGEVSLRPVQRMVSDVNVGSVGHAYLVDETGRAIADPRFDNVLARRSMTGNGIVELALASHRPQAETFSDNDGVEQLGAHAPVLFGGWRLIVQQPAADAHRPVRSMRDRALFVLLVALVASLACGYFFVRGIVGPLRQVVSGMRRIMDGHLTTRLDVRTGDEVGELARAFNVMGRMLERDKREIEAWNRELQDRVDAKTRALEDAQQKLIRSAKLSSVGQLGAGVAHELNNPLAGIVGQAALLKRRITKLELPGPEKKKLLAYVDHVQGESGRCREIIHGLLSFSQATSGEFDELDLNESLEKLLLLVHNNARSSGIEFEQDLRPGLPMIRANEGQVQQVVMHVVNNALQAMTGGGGHLAVRTRADGPGVAIEVSDTGRGIAAEHLERIFDPFFTTKDVWESTGLGLSVCHSIVESHGGRIEVESEPGHGTTVTVHLPERPPEESGEHRAAGEPVGLARTERVASA